MEHFEFSAETAARVSRTADAARLRELWNGFCFHSGSLTVTGTDEMIFAVGAAEALPVPDGAEYALNVTPAGACVSAPDHTRLMRGITDLLGRILPRREGGKTILYLPCGVRYGAFDLKTRMVHLCVFPETDFAFLKKTIRFCGVLQYTHVVLEFWGTFPFRCLPALAWRDAAYSAAQVRELLDEIRAFGMRPVPMFNHLGHAAASRSISGKHVVLDQEPSLAYLFSPDGWSWAIGTPEVDALLRAIREELFEIFGECDYFHIGIDEAYRYGVDAALAEPMLRFLNEVCKEIADTGARPILWGDLWLSHTVLGTVAGEYTCNCKNPAIADTVLNGLDKRAVIADWQYDSGGNDPVFRSASFFRERGFDVLCAPFETKSVRKNAETARQCGALGIMETTWHTLAQGFQAILACADQCRADRDPVHLDGHFNRTAAAALLRKVSPPYSRYEDTGWSRYQITKEPNR